MNPGLTRPLKVNDTVWSKYYGYGKVIIVKQGDLIKYPYIVQFNDRELTSKSFSVNGVFQISKPDAYFDLAGPLREDGTVESNELIKTVQTITVKNKENGDREGTIIDIDGCKIFRSAGSMIILPQNDDL